MAKSFWELWRAPMGSAGFARIIGVCRSGEKQSHKLPTPGGGPDEYRRAVSLFSFILRTRLAYDVSTNLER